MMNKQVIRIIFVFSIVFGLTGYHHVFSEMSSEENHQHQDMQYMPSKNGEEAVASIKTEPEHITVGTPTIVVFSIKDHQGRPITDLSIHHDRLIHVVIASQDFSVFAHIHPQDFGPITPEMKKSAQYPIKFSFPRAGRYIIGIDFAVKGQPISKHFLIHVAGESPMGQPEEDLKREEHVGDLDVKLSYSPDHISAGKEVMLSYLFRNNGEAVTDLEPYLSAPMHLAIISADLTQFIHTHGEVSGMPAMGHHHMAMDMALPKKFGPQVDVHVIFPTKGLYQIFGQVGYQGKVIATSFMIQVE